jgi:hypothetical protein
MPPVKASPVATPNQLGSTMTIGDGRIISAIFCGFSG